MNSPRHSPLCTGAAAALLELVACACNADVPGADTLNSASNVPTVRRCESCLHGAHDFTAPALETSLAAPASVNRAPPSAPDVNVVHAETATAPTSNPFANLRFRDQEPLVNRLRRLQALPFVTLWDSREATVYVGVDRRGKAGLHLRQKRDDRGARATQMLAAPVDERAPLRPPKSRRR